MPTTRLTPHQDAVYRLLCFTGRQTDAQLTATYQAIRGTRTVDLPEQTDSGIRTRRKELTTQGLVAAYPVPGLTRTGRRATQWEVIR